MIKWTNTRKFRVARLPLFSKQCCQPHRKMAHLFCLSTCSCTASECLHHQSTPLNTFTATVGKIVHAKNRVHDITHVFRRKCTTKLCPIFNTVASYVLLSTTTWLCSKRVAFSSVQSTTHTPTVKRVKKSRRLRPLDETVGIKHGLRG